MALLNRDAIIHALQRLGQLAAAEEEEIRLIAVGGAAMVLGFDARLSTRDIDALILAPSDANRVRDWAKQVAAEQDWPDDWLNDAAKGFLVGLTQGPILLQSVGIEVRRPSSEQLLAMKLSAWRDDVDISDCRRILVDLVPTTPESEVRSKIDVWK